MVTLEEVIQRLIINSKVSGIWLGYEVENHYHGTSKEIVETLESLGWEIDYTECEGWMGHFDFRFTKENSALHYYGCWYTGEQKLKIYKVGEK